MKITRKLLSLALALVMTLALCVSALADEKYTITINNSASGHTYEAYQIFAGDLYIPADREETVTQNKILSNIVWGSGVSEEGKAALGNAAEKANSLNEANVKSFAKEVADYLTAPTASGEQTDGKYIISGLAAGYYLVKDKDPNNSLSGKDDFYTAYIMKVVGNVEATPKGDKPTLEKELRSKKDSKWHGTHAGFQIGDEIEFRLIVSVPDVNAYGYAAYTYTISDTMTEGLTSRVKSADDVTIKINDEDTLNPQYYEVAVNGNSFTVSIDIKRALDDHAITAGNNLFVYYTAELNDSAIYYGHGGGSTRPCEINTASLVYPNDPNGSTTGKTADAVVKVWTFPTTITKVDGKDGATQLNGAKFVLSTDGTLTLTDFALDKNGVPTNTEKLIAFYTGAGSTAPYEIATPEMIKAGQDITYVIEAGSVTVAGLGEKTYYLYEIKAPDGYNLLTEPTKFTIHTHEGDMTVFGNLPYLTLGDDETQHGLYFNVVNNSGATLPETGGIGTTIFYAAGALLVVGAGVLLVTKKRMNKSED